MAIVTEGAEDNGGWLKKLLMWDWHDICLKGWPGWELDPSTKAPHFTNLTVTHKSSKSSRDRAIEFDDLSEGRFYYRDWTDSGLPFVEEGEVYRSQFCFEKKADKEKFDKTLNGKSTVGDLGQHPKKST